MENSKFLFLNKEKYLNLIQSDKRLLLNFINEISNKSQHLSKRIWFNFTNKTIGEIVAEDFRTAAIFKKHGIDFCCRGGRTIEEACEKKKVMEQQLIDELSALPSGKGDNVDVSSWPLDLLANYIVKIHHEYVREKTPMETDTQNSLR